MLAPIVMGLWAALVIALCAFAWRSRDAMLRAAAVIVLAGWLLTIVAENAWPHWHGLHPGVLAIDILAALGFAVIAALDRSLWAICACGFQLATVGLHFSYSLAPHYLGAAYYTGLTVIGFLLGFSILIGSLAHLAEDRQRALQ